jgi:hypothetical protein
MGKIILSKFENQTIKTFKVLICSDAIGKIRTSKVFPTNLTMAFVLILFKFLMFFLTFDILILDVLTLSQLRYYIICLFLSRTAPTKISCTLIRLFLVSKLKIKNMFELITCSNQQLRKAILDYHNFQN